ncbi:hypothetical protein P3S67_030269 [Capsicum chacoense]
MSPDAPDALSNLPDGVIDDILMKLPLRDAVRTSILSKKWRYSWCRIPQVKLDQTLWKTTKQLMSPKIGFTNVVYHLLSLHTGPIFKFTLDIPDLITCPEIDNLMHYLSRNGVRHIVLKPPLKCRPYKLLSSFFTCSQLRHLSLQDCLIRPPPAFTGFDRLISLELRRVTISSELLGRLISNCPLLEHLVLEHDEYSNQIEINAPNLSSLFFTGNINFLHFKNVPLLSKVSYEPTVLSVGAEHDLANIFESIPALENLCWNNNNVQVVNVEPAMPTRLPFALNRLKRLSISQITLGFELTFALCLVRSSPYLEEIEIQADPDLVYYKPMSRNAVDEIPASFSDMTFNHLKTVKLYNVAGAKAEMQLIKVLLVKSPTLIQMVIEPCRKVEIESEIINFQRASSKAQIVYSVKSK